MEVTGFVGFGDIQDIFLKKNKKIKSCGGTIIYEINTKREFLPGRYNLSTLHDSKVKIVHHENISPEKIDEYLMKSDIGNNFKVPNYMNRYDWMHVRNWGFPIGLFSDDESSTDDDYSSVENPDSSFDSIASTSDEELSDDSYYNMGGLKRFLKCYTQFYKDDGVSFSKRRFEHCFFVNDENLSDKFYIEEEKLIKINDKKVIGYIFKIVNGDWNWNFGCLFQDKSSGKYFAMVLEEMYTTRTKEEDENIEHEHICENENFEVNFDDFCI
ncbi:uncharacterized protein LOC111626291 [Centruroides sculpturatus]|uniref:uncharacterized protein LOC111626291 n=1 Tax=Centruroides sculpturatus TaxID=218467 RepID=UPI000C6CC977|nr:uncharacterized protein LOC111626291 [Centruroides sculpturatus]XP_023225381.1 uncharacterized protein LOC111626291 [Centruroides sculpturatus]XP_023225382.1 uncharacterized protein LOC111626291 [Centruroides sculpturatus]